MTPERLDEIRALAAEPVLYSWDLDDALSALRDLLEAHDGLRSRVMGETGEWERFTEWHDDHCVHPKDVVASLRRCL